MYNSGIFSGAFLKLHGPYMNDARHMYTSGTFSGTSCKLHCTYMNEVVTYIPQLYSLALPSKDIAHI